MRSLLAGVLVLVSLSAVRAQEALPRDEALKIACQLCRDVPKMLATPIPTDPDIKWPVGIRGDNRGLLVFPETKLRLADLAKAGIEVMPVGQLWLLRVAPVVAGQPAPADKLLLVNVAGDQTGATPALCALGVHKAADGRLELLVYGKGKEPLLHTALMPSSGAQTDPIAVSVSLEGDGLLLTLNILGQYTASFPAGLSE